MEYNFKWDSFPSQITGPQKNELPNLQANVKGQLIARKLQPQGWLKVGRLRNTFAQVNVRYLKRSRERKNIDMHLAL